jgi:FkbM family methyltransferase
MGKLILGFRNICYAFKKIVNRKSSNIETINILEAKFNIPIIDGIGFELTSMSELWMLEIIKMFKNKIADGYAIDIGANVGQTLLKFKSIIPEINYICFEPNDTAVYYLNKLIKINNIANTIILPVGISNEDAVLELLLFDDYECGSGASIIPGFRSASSVAKKKFVPVFNISKINILKQLSKISIIKIDVEGAELEVIKSCFELIGKHKPLLLIEILPVYNSDNVFRFDRQKEIEKIIKELDYNIFRIIKNEEGSFSKLEMIKDFNIHSDLKLCDYLLSYKSETLPFL